MNEIDQKRYMDHCLELAGRALEMGNPPVGAVVVLRGAIVGEGIERGKSSGDITRHAEIEALRDVHRRNPNLSLERAFLLTTHEPCIMCSYAIRHYRVGTVVFGNSVPHVGGFTSPLDVLRYSGVPRWGPPPVVLQGIRRRECETVFRRYEKLHHRGRQGGCANYDR